MSGLAFGGRPWIITNISSSIIITSTRSGLRINMRERDIKR